MTVDEFFFELDNYPCVAWYLDSDGCFRTLKNEGEIEILCPITYLTWKKYKLFFDLNNYKEAASVLDLPKEDVGALIYSADGGNNHFTSRMVKLLKELKE
ncbi:MAG: hypothetical protein ACRDF4_08850 [Rhabdochlamydiaceae bacterium]